MSQFKQIDGVKNVLVDDNGRVRRGLRTLRPEKGEHGWPVVEVQSGNPQQPFEERIIAAEVLKLFGGYPQTMDIGPDDIEAKDGDKTNNRLDNLTYTGPGSKKEKQAEQADAEEEDEADAETVETPEPAETPDEEDRRGTKDEETGERTIQATDFDYAKEAIQFIDDCPADRLVEMNFLEGLDENEWVSVRRAFNEKVNEGGD